MKFSTNLKQLQSFNGKVVELNRFISKSTDKCLSFFTVLKKEFEWTDECEQAFAQLKLTWCLHHSSPSWTRETTCIFT